MAILIASAAVGLAIHHRSVPGALDEDRYGHTLNFSWSKRCREPDGRSMRMCDLAGVQCFAKAAPEQTAISGLHDNLRVRARIGHHWGLGGGGWDTPR